MDKSWHHYQQTGESFIPSYKLLAEYTQWVESERKIFLLKRNTLTMHSLSPPPPPSILGGNKKECTHPLSIQKVTDMLRVPNIGSLLNIRKR